MRNVIIMTIACLFCFKVNAQEANSVADGQAIFVYNFTKLVAWPESRKANDFVIGVLGSSETFQAIKKYMQQKRVASQNITVKRFQKSSDVESGCHILLVTSSSAKEISSLTDKVVSESMLLIAENDGSIDQGAAINFLVIDGKIKYEVKSSNLEKCQLKHVAQLEALAYKKY